MKSPPCFIPISVDLPTSFCVALPLRSPSISPSLHSDLSPSLSLSKISADILGLLRANESSVLILSNDFPCMMLIASYRYYADFLAGSFPSSSSAGLGSPATQGTSVPQPQPASIIEDRLLNELLVAPGRELLPKLSPNGEPNTSW
ncbi:hypothetical protein F2Q70_00028236 [Brassica cretica]|uniref:Uncharacterized protein n=1 Tax=Brassica cretica TaxID=69181 RepID=A0A8S9LF05_BRACR|nr:hypothetical protein F2Q70_00028236 [Brassica cretica]